MDWNYLPFVLALSRHGSLSAASRSLSVEHTTVSRRLASLEETLRARLFDRTPDGYVATAVGEIQQGSSPIVIPHGPSRTLTSSTPSA